MLRSFPSSPGNEPEDVSTHKAPSQSSRVGSAVKWTLATLLGAGATGGVGYNVYRQNALEQENGHIQRVLSEEQLRREAMQGLLDEQAERLLEERASRELLQRNVDSRVTVADLSDAVDMVKQATVRVEGPLGLGSGVIITDRLGRMYILTNGHVTEGNEFHRGGVDEFQDGVYHATLYTGNDFKQGVSFDAAPVIGREGKRAHSYSSRKDLSLLRIPPEIEQQIIEGKIPVPHIRVCDRTKNPLKAGDRVIAIGNPFGERDHVTDGIVSSNDAFGGIEPENVFIRTSAPINPGNSGGGLFRVRRENGKLITELVGINTWGYRGGDGVSGSIDIRVIALQCHEWGVPIVSDEEFAEYQRWWKETVEPSQKARVMPPADD